MKRDFALIKHSHALGELLDLDLAGVVDNSLIQYDSSTSTWMDVTIANVNGQLDHGLLLGLADDDHPQYTQWAQAETINENWTWTDNDEVRLGTGGDLRLYHDGTNSFIRNDTGKLIVQMGAALNSAFQVAGGLTIGSASDLARGLGVLGASGYSYGSFRQFSNVAIGPTIEFTHSRNATLGSHTIVQDGDAIGTYQFYGSDGVGFISTAAIQAFITGTPGVNNMPGRITFFTNAGAASPTARWHVLPNGNFKTNADNLEIQLGLGTGVFGTGDLRLYHDGTNSFITNNTGKLIVESTASEIEVRNLITKFTNTGGPLFRWIDGDAAANEKVAEWRNNTGVVTLAYRDDSELNPLTAISFHRSGTTPTSVRLPQDNEELQIGAGQDLRLYHDGTDSFIRNDTGALRLNIGATTQQTLTAALALFLPPVQAPLCMSQRIISTAVVMPANTSAIVSQSIEMAAGASVNIGAGAVLEIT